MSPKHEAWVRKLNADVLAKKEAKRLEKLAKAAVKAVTPASTGAPSARKEKKEKEKEAKAAAAPVEAWVNTTPAGEKKGKSFADVGRADTLSLNLRCLRKPAVDRLRPHAGRGCALRVVEQVRLLQASLPGGRHAPAQGHLQHHLASPQRHRKSPYWSCPDHRY